MLAILIKEKKTKENEEEFNFNVSGYYILSRGKQNNCNNKELEAAMLGLHVMESMNIVEFSHSEKVTWTFVLWVIVSHGGRATCCDRSFITWSACSW